LLAVSDPDPPPRGFPHSKRAESVKVSSYVSSACAHRPSRSAIMVV
jgi:hypothetical protein